jgi:hypothetical protein
VLDPHLVERVAEDLGTSPGLVEKDWHVVRALAVIEQVDAGGMAPAFSGGTSLSGRGSTRISWRPYRSPVPMK